MNETPRPVSARHRARLAAAVGALALALGVASACANPIGGSQASNHACADKVAQATTTSSPVAGLWACLDADLQRAINAGGSPNAGTDAALSINVGLVEHYLGSNADYATYEVTLTPSIAAQAGTKTIVLVVWLDSAGKVSNAGIPNPAF